MKKALKITGWTLLAIVVLAVVGILLVRYVFRQQALEYVYQSNQQERVELLRTAGPYAADTVSYRFAYRQDSVRAREIGDYFRLDTIVAPEASTWDNTLALARFVARNIPHANQKVYPEACTATGLWEYTRTVEPAFNCRLHAILLHELLFAEGIVNRFVTCLPADSLDSDCHVVNQVWLPERNQWAMIDSDQQAWVAAPDGTPLSLAQMRERYLKDEPMEVHPLFDSDKSYSYYRSYWAKNLYWFSCWEETGYGKEIERHGSDGRMIYLVPAGFEGFKLREQRVLTTDAERFWAAPNSIIKN